jgi:hypothetical protein
MPFPRINAWRSLGATVALAATVMMLGVPAPPAHSDDRLTNDERQILNGVIQECLKPSSASTAAWRKCLDDVKYYSSELRQAAVENGKSTREADKLVREYTGMVELWLYHLENPDTTGCAGRDGCK